MDKIVKQILNSIKCPICKSQVDILDFGNFKSREYNYSCASNWEHYRINLIDSTYPPQIKKEEVWVFADNKLYTIIQAGTSLNKTQIEIFDTDAENRIIISKSNGAKHFNYDKFLFDFSKTNCEKILNRIKTILLFQ